jgi:hypothetical protein
MYLRWLEVLAKNVAGIITVGSCLHHLKYYSLPYTYFESYGTGQARRTTKPSQRQKSEPSFTYPRQYLLTVVPVGCPNLRKTVQVVRTK